MMRASLFSLCLAGTCAVAFLVGCGDSDEAGTGGTTTDAGRPPLQRAVSLFTKQPRPAGTSFHNSATLTMADAALRRRSGDETVNGEATTVMRQRWGIDQVSPTERQLNIEEMSMTFESNIGGKAKEDRNDSTLGGIVFKVQRDDESAPWKLVPPEDKLTHLQEVELGMLGNLWEQGSSSIYPEELLQLGQSWKADPKAFGMIVSPRLTVDEGEVNCRLDEITVLRGERCASIGVDIDITGRIEVADGAGMQVQIALTGTILRSLYKFYDMRTELKGSMQWEMEFPDGGRISIDGVAEFLQLADMEVPGAPAAAENE